MLALADAAGELEHMPAAKAGALKRASIVGSAGRKSIMPKGKRKSITGIFSRQHSADSLHSGDVESNLHDGQPRTLEDFVRRQAPHSAVPLPEQFPRSRCIVS